MTSASPHGRPEQKLQTQIVVRFRREFDCLVFAVPNGGSRVRLEAIHMKNAGVTAGHPDLIIYGRQGRSFLLEVKRPGGGLSQAQKAVIPQLEDRGFPVFVVDTVEAAVAAAARFGLDPKRSAPPAPPRDAGGF